MQLSHNPQSHTPNALLLRTLTSRSLSSILELEDILASPKDRFHVSAFADANSLSSDHTRLLETNFAWLFNHCPDTLQTLLISLLSTRNGAIYWPSACKLLTVDYIISTVLRARGNTVIDKDVLLCILRSINEKAIRDSRYIVVLNIYCSACTPCLTHFAAIDSLLPHWAGLVNTSLSPSVQKHARELIDWCLISTGTSERSLAFVRQFDELQSTFDTDKTSHFLLVTLQAAINSGHGQGFYKGPLTSIKDLSELTRTTPSTTFATLRKNFQSASNIHINSSAISTLRVKKLKNYEKWLEEPLPDDLLSADEVSFLDKHYLHLFSRLAEDSLDAAYIINYVRSLRENSITIEYRLKLYDLTMLFLHPHYHVSEVCKYVCDLTSTTLDALLGSPLTETQRQHYIRFFLYASRNFQSERCTLRALPELYNGLARGPSGNWTIGYSGDATSLYKQTKHLLYNKQDNSLVGARVSFASYLNIKASSTALNILVFCSEDYIALFDEWLHYIEPNPLFWSNKDLSVIVLCLDPTAYQHLTQHYAHYAHIDFVKFYILSGHHDAYTILFRERLYILHDMVCRQRNTLVCGLDTLFVRFNDFKELCRSAVLVTASDSGVINGDCVYLQSTPRNRRFVKQAMRYACAGFIDQTALNLAFKDLYGKSDVAEALTLNANGVDVRVPDCSGTAHERLLFLGRATATRSQVFLSRRTIIFQPHLRHLVNEQKLAYTKDILASDLTAHEFTQWALR